VAVLLDLVQYEKLADRVRFIDAVEEGLAAAESGDLHPNEAAMKILESFGKEDGG
jgi:predicted transcriptional regulator